MQKVGKGGGKIGAQGGHRKVCPKATYSMKRGRPMNDDLEQTLDILLKIAENVGYARAIRVVNLSEDAGFDMEHTFAAARLTYLRMLKRATK